MKKLFISNKIKVRFIFLFFSIFLILSYIIIDKIFFYNYTKNVLIKEAIDEAYDKEKTIQSFISNSKNTLKSIRNSEVFNDYLNNQSIQNTEHLKKLFLIMMDSNTNFMQLRYLDKNGKEKIRIDRKEEFGKTFPIEDKDLQNKSERYYFSKSKTKELEKVWFSDLDLNIENEKLEIPYRSTLRAVLPIKYKNNFGGIIIINYFMNSFLENFIRTTLYNIILVDSKGYTIKHYLNHKSWGIYKKEKYNISLEFKDYEKILSSDIYKSDDYLSKKLTVPFDNHPIIILEPKKEYIQNEVNEKNIQYLTIGLIAVFLAFIAIYFITNILESIIGDLNRSEKLNKKLSELNSKLTAILNTTKDSVCLLDKDTKFMFVNKATVEITGYSKEELLNKTFVSIINSDDDKEKFNFILEKLIYQNEVKSFEVNCISKENKLFVFSLSLVLMPNNNEILVVSRDITDLKEKEKELKSKEQILIHQSKMVAMGEMIENIAHQWRQPLSVISTNVSGLQLQKQYDMLSEEMIDEVLNSILDTTKHLSSTIDDFRDFFNQNKKIEKFKISSAIGKTLFLLSSKFNSRDIIVEVSKSDIEINTLKNEFVQCLMNILSNAKDELEKIENHHLRLILITITNDKNNCYIDIVDNAGGIKEEILDKIFEPYFTTKNEKGTGIGLYMTKLMIEKHMNGSIEVKNHLFEYKGVQYKGAMFKITLPLSQNKA
jgi:PAS domain S-box-containing protein